MTPGRWAVLVVILGTALFGAAMAGRHAVDPWLTNAAAATITILLSAAVLRRGLGRLLAFRTRTALLAAALGALMVAGTHLSFQGAVHMLPNLAAEVERLYRDISAATLGLAMRLLLVVLIVAAEEFLWRGVVVELCHSRLSRTGTVLVATILYALPQLIGGSWVLVAAATAAGTVFTLQRVLTGRVTDPLITHTLWSVAVFEFLPLV